MASSLADPWVTLAAVAVATERQVIGPLVTPVARRQPQARGSADGSFDLVVTNPPGTDPEPWVGAGATWCPTGFGPQPTAEEVQAAIDAGP